MLQTFKFFLITKVTVKEKMKRTLYSMTHQEKEQVKHDLAKHSKVCGLDREEVRAPVH